VTTGSAGTVYVYGVLLAEKAAKAAPAAVDGTDVRVVHSDALAALVSDRGPEGNAGVDEVRRHWRVLDEVTKRGATVIPVRFGTVMESDDAVREQLLERHAERLSAIHDRLAGRIQLGVTGRYDEERELEDIVRRTPEIARLRDRVRGLPEAAGRYDRINLGSMVSAEMDRRRAEDGNRARTSLEPLAASAVSQPPAGADGAFDLVFLVDRDKMDAFSAAVQHLADDLAGRVAVRYVGPQPPFHFADAELTEGSPAWA
jgi:hypothetical protein